MEENIILKNIGIICNEQNYLNDFAEVIKLFNPHNDFQMESTTRFIINFNELNDGLEVEVLSNLIDSNVMQSINSNKFATNYNEITNDGNKIFRQYNSGKITNSNTSKLYAEGKRYAKRIIYEELSQYFEKDLPYGSLTGIRPTKLYRETNMDKTYFSNFLHVSKEKLSLIDSIVQLQKDYYVKDDDVVDVFINIPFCTTRCSYCSFISAEIGRVKKFIPEYVNDVVREINDVKRIIADNNYRVRAIYIGGGTPTSLDDDVFNAIISACDFDADEFTVEAGRPDTITRNKLDIMKKNHVTRISINPQTFNAKTLELIGRSHSVEAIYEVYDIAKGYGFDINMDLIAMLPDESLDDFKYSVNEAIKLNPANITVHTLALKNGSKLKEAHYAQDMTNIAEEMVSYAREKLNENGYKPYYMYRQKYMSGNMENTGYAKDNKVCLYNIDIMEESLSIIASGAGGISKRTFSNENRLERLANAKGLSVYLERIDKAIEDKYNFFKKI